MTSYVGRAADKLRRHKRGDPFDWAGILRMRDDANPLPVVTGASSHFRRAKTGQKLSEAVVTVSAPIAAGEYPVTVEVEDTIGWPAGDDVLFDVRLTFDTAPPITSRTATIRCVERQTDA